MNTEQNQINTMEEFVRQHAWLSSCGDASILVPNIDTIAQTRDDFFQLHDGFERANALYQEFMENYSSVEGELELNQCRNLFNILRTITADYLGDIENVFRPLNEAGNFFRVRAARTVTDSGSYHLLPQDARNEYEERLTALFSQLRDGQGDYEMNLAGNTANRTPQELWQLHLAPRRFFDSFFEILRLESIAPHIDDNITTFELAEAWNQGEHYSTDTLFGENAGERLSQRYPESRINVSMPSLQSLRTLLPLELEPAEMFNPYPVGYLRQSLQNLNTTNQFDSYRSEATQNGWRGIQND